MSNQEPSKDPFDVIRQAGTGAPNFDMDNHAIITRLQQWQEWCTLRVVGAGHDTVDIKFDTLPADLDAFVQPLSGLINHLAMTQGSPALRANPGLNDGTPLGF